MRFKLKENLSFEVDVIDSVRGEERTPYQIVRVWARTPEGFAEPVLFADPWDMLPSRRYFILERE